MKLNIPEPREPDASAAAIAALMMDFESIGPACEFGVVQRCRGAEPLSLLRFSSSSIANLTQLLQNELAGFMTAYDIEIVQDHSEYMIFSRHYDDFLAHTNTPIAGNDPAKVLAREVTKFGYLKRRFEADWTEAARVYVHCGCADEAAILRLHDALRRRSDRTLLWVTRAHRPEDRGRVETV